MLVLHRPGFTGGHLIWVTLPFAVRRAERNSIPQLRALLDDLVSRGRKTPELVIVDGAPGLEKTLVALWSDMPLQRCTVHKPGNSGTRTFSR